MAKHRLEDFKYQRAPWVESVGEFAEGTLTFARRPAHLYSADDCFLGRGRYTYCQPQHSLENRGAELVGVHGLLCFVRKPYKETIGKGRYGTR